LVRAAGVAVCLAMLAQMAQPVGLEAAQRAVPTAEVSISPAPAYAGVDLRGSARIAADDRGPVGGREGASAFRWLVDGATVQIGQLPQTTILPMDGSLNSIAGQPPARSTAVEFAPGLYGDAAQFSSARQSELFYGAAGVIDPDEGTLEMWVQLAADLQGLGTADHPRLFSYVVDSSNQLNVEINSGRVIVTSRKEGLSKGTWPQPVSWRAGEWHHITATWSRSLGRQAIYYDCAPMASANFYGLTGGPAAEFSLGGGSVAAAVDGALDDIRISSRRLDDAEIGRACTRGGPAPNDETVLPRTQFNAGQTVTLEITPCDTAGQCGTPASATVTVAPPPLGELSPVTGVLVPGTVTATLELATAADADCRWSGHAGTPFADMTSRFDSGDGTQAHKTLITGLSDLAERWFYVRCLDRTGGRSPDDFERISHIRVMGPWTGGYPRLANLWGDFRPELGLDYYASYQLYVPESWDGHLNQARAIRAINPNTKILMTGHATYDWPQVEPLTAAWMNSGPDDPYHYCVFRTSSGSVLMAPDVEHPMYNLTLPICRERLLQNDIDAFLSPRPDLGDNLAYDGIYWDRLYNAISWLLGPDIDGDGDGQPDDPQTLDAAYRFGVLFYLTRVRAALPQAILMANDAPLEYASWLNGRAYEWQMASLLDDIKPDLHWPDLSADYQAWSAIPSKPNTTMLAGATDPLYQAKYPSSQAVPAAVAAEASSAYRRMRFGLATALMGNGMYAFDYGPYGLTQPWWYDEYGAPAVPGLVPSQNLPPRGYLGQPVGAPQLLAGKLTTPAQTVNGTFDNGLTGWSLWVPDDNPARAELTLDPAGGVNGTGAAHIVVGAAADQTAVEFRQSGLATLADQSYTLSFWARSSITRTLLINIKKNPDGENYGFFGLHATVTPTWQHLYLSDVMTVTAADGKLEFLMGDQPGDVWLDEIQFQAGAVGVWARPFENGLAVANSAQTAQTINVPPGYCRMVGSQAPYFATRVDDDAASADGAWTARPAAARQFGTSVQTAAGGSGAAMTYRPELAYPGSYEVLAWVTPQLGQSDAVQITIHSADGDKKVTVDETAGAPGWRSLGTYKFSTADLPSATLEASGDGTVVADALAWVSNVRYNEGEPVTQLTMQPQDGIILTTACAR
jgi:hypothetical protein